MASLDLTHVLYDDSSIHSLAFALVTLTPILLMPAYAALVVQTRELVIINMWAGQFLCTGLNWILKRIVKQHRPTDSLSHGYGFPSSHCQYMGFFSTFLMCHIYFRHRFAPTGSSILDWAWRKTVYLILVGWASLVAYSRFHLNYHTPHQILWGVAIGIAFGITFYIFTELIPMHRPNSHFGRLRRLLLENPISTWLCIRDGWLIWPDGGQAEEWNRWRLELDKRRRQVPVDVKRRD